MIILFRHKLTSVLAHLIDRLSWPLVFGALLVHFFGTWMIMRVVEPESKIAELEVYWWFYIVTATTIGYGDYTPVTLEGRATALVVMIFGIALLGGIIGKIASFAINYAETRRNGMATLTIRNHVVVVGKDSYRTMDLLRNLMAGTHSNIVLVSDHTANPFRNGSLAGFVSGSIDNDEVQSRACLRDSSVVIIIADDDVTAVGKAVAVNFATTEKTRVVVFFQDKTNARRFDSQTPDRVKCVPSVDMSVLVQEAEDPGAADYVSRLLDNTVAETFGRCVVPQGASPRAYHEIVTSLIRQKVAVLGFYGNDGHVVICPDPDRVVTAGDVLAIATSNPARLEKLSW